MNTSTATRADTRLGLLLISPALLVVFGVALVPLAVTAWEAAHQHDLSLPWLGTPSVGFGNAVEAAGDPRVAAALLRTSLFAAISVPLELTFGLALALVMHRFTRARTLARVATLMPFALPTVVAALLWRFIVESGSGGIGFDWFGSPLLAWVPIVVADVWKTTPFVALLLLAGLQAIDQDLYDAARMDGAGALRRLWTITIPLLKPAFVVAAGFRTLDALRLFDLPYVMTGGGPGTATEPVSLYAFSVLMQRLRFGYGSALSMLIFALALVVAFTAVRLLSHVSPSERR
jgi:ABC-type sugar transport system permease subunit